MPFDSLCADFPLPVEQCWMAIQYHRITAFENNSGFRSRVVTITIPSPLM
jgi:hypothetical protein